MNRKVFLVLLALTLLAGLFFSSWSLNDHFSRIKDPNYSSAGCTINSTINCALADQSEYSSFYGVPVAGMSALHYTFLLLLTFLRMKANNQSRPLFLISGIFILAGLVFSLGMAFISIFKLHVICPVCFGLYCTAILSVVFFYLSRNPQWEKSMSAFINNTSTRKVLFGLLLGAIFIFAGSYYLKEKKSTIQAAEKAKAASVKISTGTNSQNPIQLSVEDLVKIHMSQAPIEIKPPADQVYGNPNAAVKVIEFSDFQCPYCKKAAETIKPALAEFGDKVGLFFVNYPLDNQCNPSMQRSMHPFACMAAKATICAGQKGKFWEVHDQLFADQKGINAENIMKWLSNVGIDAKSAQDCIDSEKTKIRLADDIKMGNYFHIQGTPSVFVNGRKVELWSNTEYFKALIREEIRLAEGN